MAKVDVVVIGAGAAGLTAGALLAKEGKQVLVLDKSPHLGGRGMAVPDEGFRLNVGGHLLEDSGSGITKVFEVLGKRLGHGTVSSDMPVWDHTRPLELDPRPLLGQQGRAEEGHQGPARDALRGLRAVGRPLPARVDPPVHRRPGRRRPVGVPRRARVPHRRMVGPLRERQPLRAQDALRGEADGRLLVLARAGLGRPLPRSRRRRRRERRRGAHEHAGRARDRSRTTRSRASPSRGSPGSSRTRSSRTRCSSADAVVSTLPVWNVLSVVPEWELPDWYAGQIRFLAQAALQGHLARALPRDRRAGGHPRPQGARHLAARADHPAPRASSSSRRRWIPRRAPRHAPLRRAAVVPGAKGRDRRYLLESSRSSRRSSGSCTRGSRSRSGAGGTSSTTPPSA